MSQCKSCGRSLSADEMSLYMKIVDIGASSYLCIDCLGDFLDCETELLQKKIIHYRNMGCTLFAR